jgi:hypothetical protein
VSQASAIFKLCVQAIVSGELIRREGAKDKEFHFQNWFSARLRALGVQFDEPGRNTYPDFRLVEHTEGYEIKGLAYPGREADYDCNSQVPCGDHNGRSVYYVFGRYPARPDGDTYPVLDFVMCHGSFLNAYDTYVHENKSFRGFGSYGDILVRDRKMYVAPTPFALADGTAHRRTLIVPADEQVDRDLVPVGRLMRAEVDQIVGAYSFDLETRQLQTRMIPNPGAGKVHVFTAYRMADEPADVVTVRDRRAVLAELQAAEAEEDAD